MYINSNQAHVPYMITHLQYLLLQLEFEYASKTKFQA